MAEIKTSEVKKMGFDWIKIFDPPGQRFDANVLLRVDAVASHMSDVDAFAANVRNIAAWHGSKIEAYEIGNESNLNASYGWTAPPNATDYVQLLCAAYDEIHAMDSDAVVISTGLAPTGRVSGNWNGHAGHNGLFQDEREWLKEFLAAGGAECADAIGYHPYGYAANYDAEPDVTTGIAETNCTNGFCFRGVEKIYDILVEHGVDDKQIWATEYGWIVQPPDECMDDAGWQGRAWQIVSEQAQADNLVGSFAYADEHWPWMGPMFLFNYNFNTAWYYDDCEQMRFYGVKDRLAEAALTAMPKRYATDVVPLIFEAPSLTWLVETTATEPLEAHFVISNTGVLSAEFSLSINAHTITPTLSVVSGTLSVVSGTLPAGGTQPVTLTLDMADRPAGTYTATITFASDFNGTVDMPVTLVVTDQLNRIFIPVADR